MAVVFSDKDLEAAIYSNHVDNNALIQQNAPGTSKLTTLKDKIISYEWSLWAPMPGDEEGKRAFDQSIPACIEKYQHGKTVQERAEVITSEPKTVPGDPDQEFSKDRAIVSPIEQWQAGHVATNPRWYYVALAWKKGSAEELQFFAERASAK